MTWTRILRVGFGLLLITGLTGLTGCSSPGTITVTTTADTVADDGQTSLREAFATANGDASRNTILLAPDATYELTDCAAGGLVHTAQDELVIDGKRATIRQTCTDAGILASTAFRVFRVANVTLDGGPSSGASVVGAAIRAPNLSLSSVVVTDVHAGPGGTVVETGVAGGGPPSLVAIDSSRIVDSSGAAALRITNSLARVETLTVSRIAGDGIRAVGRTSLSVSSWLSVTDNDGWGIDADLVDGGLSGSFVSAERNGRGGISCAGCSQVDLTFASVVDNGGDAAPGSGGGIAVTVDGSDPALAPRIRVSSSTISGNWADRAGGGLSVGAGSTDPTQAAEVELSETTVIGNTTTGAGRPGGGVAVTTGNLTVFRSEIRANTAAGSGSDGGGVYFTGLDSAAEPSTYTDEESRFTENTSGGRGGGLYVGRSVDGRIERSTFDANTATVAGGGTAAGPLTRLTLSNATVTGNSSPRGGGISVGADAEELALEHVTLAGNTAPAGANLASDGGRVETFASLLVQPGGGGANCAAAPGDVDPQGSSFLSDASCAAGPTDTVSADDPLLGALVYNGGPGVPTLLPAPASPIGGTVPVDVCTIGVDQRGQARPTGPACEPGSVEISEDGGS